MGLTNFPNGIFATPNLGGQLPPLLCMQTDAKSIFVDGARPVSGSGQSPADAFNTIQAAITAAKQFDVIYVITKPISASGTGVTGKYTEILTVLKAQQMLTIVGVGPNTTGGRPPMAII